MLALEKIVPQTMTVAGIALESPAAISIFEDLGINYCCHGEQTLEAACAGAGITWPALRAALQDAQEMQEKEVAAESIRRWLSEPVFGLVAFIEGHHHFFTRRQLVRIDDILSRIGAQDRDGRAAVLQTVFHRLMRALLPHMSHEEGFVFPYFTELESLVSRGEPLADPSFGSLASALGALRHEHQDFGGMLQEMRELTSHYTLPADSPIGWHYLYEELRAFEHDLRRHLHLENNILFPRAEKLEARRIPAALAQGA